MHSMSVSTHMHAQHTKIKLDIVVHVSNTSTWKVVVGGSKVQGYPQLWVQTQPGLHDILLWGGERERRALSVMFGHQVCWPDPWFDLCISSFLVFPGFHRCLRASQSKPGAGSRAVEGPGDAPSSWKGRPAGHRLRTTAQAQLQWLLGRFLCWDQDGCKNYGHFYRKQTSNSCPPPDMWKITCQSVVNTAYPNNEEIAVKQRQICSRLLSVRWWLTRFCL